MEKQRQQGRKWRMILTLVTIAALGGLVYAVRKEIGETITRLGEVNTWALLLVFPLQFLNYHAYTRMYQTFFKFMGHDVDYWKMYRTNLELNFVNNVFPSGGVSGFSFFGIKMREFGISAGKATLVQLMKFVLLFISFQVLLIVGLFILALEGKASGITILISGSLATVLLIGTMLMGFIIGSKERINEFFTLVTQAINRLIHIVRRNDPETINIAKVRRLFSELHENYMLVRRDWEVLRRAFLFSLLANTTELLTIYIVYLAFGQWVNPGAVILAYAIANFAGTISVLPGGVGIYEGLMTAVLLASGVPTKVSIPVTVMYRILNMTVQLVPGGYFYHKTLHQPNGDKVADATG